MLWGHFVSGLSSGLTVAGAVEQGGLLEDMHGWMLSRFSHVQLFEIPWTVAYRAPLSMRFSREEYWSGLPCPPPGDLPNPGIEFGSPALQAEFFIIRATREGPLYSHGV